MPRAVGPAAIDEAGGDWLAVRSPRHNDWFGLGSSRLSVRLHRLGRESPIGQFAVPRVLGRQADPRVEREFTKSLREKHWSLKR